MDPYLDYMDFADDIALLSQNKQQIQDKTSNLKEISETVGLKIHPGKTKVLRVQASSEEAIMLGDNALENVDSFTYLGSILDKKGGVTADIRSRIGKARQNFGRLRPVWKSPKLKTKTSLRILNSNVKSVLLYGSETWCLTKENGNRIINDCSQQENIMFGDKKCEGVYMNKRSLYPPNMSIIEGAKYEYN